MNEAQKTWTDSTDLQEHLIAALRAELEEYGGLLSLLNLQQDALIHRNTEALLPLVERIDAQVEGTHLRRKEREALAPDLMALRNLDGGKSLRDVAPHFRAAVRPLVEALADEVNRLIAHTRRRARQNQMLLARALQVSQEVLSTMHPLAMTKTYEPNGRIKITAVDAAPRLLNVG